MSAAGLRTAAGGEGALLSLEGERVVVLVPEPAAPGQPLVLALSTGQSLRLKVYRCRRRGAEGEPVRYEIEGRLVDASRALRAVLEGLLRPPAASSD